MNVPAVPIAATPSRTRGFTLLELLVAIALFAVVAGLAYGGLDALSRGSLQLADTMSSYWVNFARSGDPNGPNLSVWQAHEVRAGERALALCFAEDLLHRNVREGREESARRS